MVLQNARRLSSPETVAILGTIPAAVAGGPLCVLLKCLTVCRLAAALGSSGIDAVPVCWVDPKARGWVGTESAWLLDSEAKHRELSVADAEAAVHAGAIEALITSVEQMAPGQQSAETLEFLRKNYAGSTLSSACCRLISALTHELGLVVIDAGEPQFESVVSEKIDFLAKDASLAVKIRTRKEELQQAGYTLREHASEAPGVLVPIVQSFLLPVAIQVCDPMELCLRSLVEPLFEPLRLPAPVAWPRASATLLDTRSRRFLNKHGLRLNELFADQEELLRRILNEPARQIAIERFGILEKAIQERLDDFLALARPDDNLRALVESSRGKMLYQVGKLNERFLAAIQMRREAVQRQLERTCNTLAPAGKLQEVILGSLHFLLRHTIALVRFLYENLDVSALEHQTLSVD